MRVIDWPKRGSIKQEIWKKHIAEINAMFADGEGESLRAVRAYRELHWDTRITTEQVEALRELVLAVYKQGVKHGKTP